MKFIKNICPFIPSKNMILFSLLFFPLLTRAQNDTTILADSLPRETIVAPVEETPPADITTEGVKTDYFLAKSESPGDSSIHQRFVPDSARKKMQQDDDFWYAYAEIKKEKKNEN